ncbi:MAG: cobalamin biosynthesis protein [Pseudomonadota bacterium]
MAEPVVLALFAHAAPLAERAAAAIGGRADIRGRDFEAAADHIRALFAAGHPVIGFCAAGILIRALAPLIGDKRREPPVLAVSEDGATVIPLLGGHRGANALANRLARALGGAAATTTAGEVRLGVALDDPPEGWRLDNPEAAKPAMAALLAGEPAALSGGPAFLAPLVETGRAVARPAPDPDAPMVLSVEGAAPLIYRRQAFALGVGCVRGCPPEELIGHALRSLTRAGRAPGEIACVASLDLKADEAAVQALARHLDVPAWFYPAARLEAETPRLAAPSTAVFAEVGCHGVAESAALAAAGEGGSLALSKRKSAQATCALARLGSAPEPGQPRGQLAIIGIGPGHAGWRTAEAAGLIADAEILVGYRLYLDLLGPLARGKTLAAFDLGEEETRCRHALEAAGTGRRVALICSGDGGIYAMGALVMELLDRPETAGGVSAAARRVEILHAPGISAMQAASARAGTLLGHDFCAISLSDLLTPAEDIRRRIRAAAEGDFVVAFYNPVSRKRRTLLAEARDTLLQHRPADTPVLLAANLGRPAERLQLIALADLDVAAVDMLTLVLVGASASRRIRSGDAAAGAGGVWAYTPRGYAAKRDRGDAKPGPTVARNPLTAKSDR